jgi:hypothetical protein
MDACINCNQSKLHLIWSSNTNFNRIIGHTLMQHWKDIRSKDNQLI